MRAMSGTKKATATGRKRSLLTAVGDEGARRAKAAMLLGACLGADWNLSRVAERLGMTSASDVLRALKELLPEQLEAARKRGDISPQNRA